MLPQRSIFLLSLLLGFSLARELKEIFKWKQMTYDVPAETSDSDHYNSVPMGVTHHKGRLFVAIPRRAPDVLSTLNVIDMSTVGSNQSPPVRPYPTLEMNQINSSLPLEERLISVYRMRVDTCERLWFTDTGRHIDATGTVVERRITIWAIDTTTDTVVERFPFPDYISEDGAGSVNLAVDIPNDKDCGGAFVYIPDLWDARVFVFSLREKKMWRFRNNFFYMNPHHGDYTISGLDFQWPDAVFSITLSGQNCRGYRTAYFHPMSSYSEFSVSTEVLRNESLTQRRDPGDDFKYLGDRGDKTQSSSHYYDNTTGVLFFALVNLNGVGCWNTAKPLNPKNFGIVMQNEKTFIYPSDLNIDSKGHLWVLTNTMPLWFYEELDRNEYNFRVWSASTKEAIRGTVCEL